MGSSYKRPSKCVSPQHLYLFPAGSVFCVAVAGLPGCLLMGLGILAMRVLASVWSGSPSEWGRGVGRGVEQELDVVGWMEITVALLRASAFPGVFLWVFLWGPQFVPSLSQGLSKPLLGAWAIDVPLCCCGRVIAEVSPLVGNAFFFFKCYLCRGIRFELRCSQSLDCMGSLTIFRL